MYGRYWNFEKIKSCAVIDGIVHYYNKFHGHISGGAHNTLTDDFNWMKDLD